VELRLVREDITSQLRKLDSLIQQVNLFESEVEDRTPDVAGPGGTRVFVVHGHDGETKHEVARFLELILGERPIILHEQADMGRTIIEKFEDHVDEIGFAVILLTGDDVGNTKAAETMNPRARQNVVFEHGFFLGKLGRSRVVAIHEPGVELPGVRCGQM